MSTEEIEKSIIKKYRKEIWSPFVKAIKNYELILEGDKIAVCVSGGKDSNLMVKCLQELKAHGKVNFDLVFLIMDPGYNKENRDLIISNSKKLGFDPTIFDTNIFDVAFNTEKSPCYLCARMRRGYLYKKAQELGCNKIALGHHYDDVIETILLSILYAGEFRTMMPKLRSTNFDGMELIRPMYLVKEEAIINWVRSSGLNFLNCACRFTECSIDEDSTSKRAEMKKLVASFRKISPYIDKNIFKSVENVNLETIISYHEGKETKNFLDDY